MAETRFMNHSFIHSDLAQKTKKLRISHRTIDSSIKCGIKSYLYRHPLQFLKKSGHWTNCHGSAFLSKFRKFKLRSGASHVSKTCDKNLAWYRDSERIVLYLHFLQQFSGIQTQIRRGSVLLNMLQKIGRAQWLRNIQDWSHKRMAGQKKKSIDQCTLLPFSSIFSLSLVYF